MTLPCSESAAPPAHPAIRTAPSPCSAYLSSSSSRICPASGPYWSKKSFFSLRSRCARSRRVRSGALNARWQSRSNGSASGWFRRLRASSSKSIPSSSWSMMADRVVRIGPIVAQLGRVAVERADLLGGVIGELARPRVDCRRGPVHRPDGRRSRRGRRRSRYFAALRLAARRSVGHAGRSPVRPGSSGFTTTVRL